MLWLRHRQRSKNETQDRAAGAFMRTAPAELQTGNYDAVTKATKAV